MIITLKNNNLVCGYKKSLISAGLYLIKGAAAGGEMSLTSGCLHLNFYDIVHSARRVYHNNNFNLIRVIDI